MLSEKRLTRVIKRLPKKSIYSYSDVKEKLNDIDSSTLSKTIMCLHKKGVVTHVDRGMFKKEEPINSLLFVYGSLKKGFQNHDIIKEATYKCKVRTRKKFAMYEEPFGNYPYLIDKGNQGHKIEGELYEINRKDLLDAIDEFEGAPTYYVRKSIMVEMRNGEIKKALAYFFASQKIPDNQTPLEEWTDNKDRYLKIFQDYHKSMSK